MVRRFVTARLPQPDGFVHRGHEVSRLEAFSDAVFGFAITLLVVSLEVPISLKDLLDRMSGFLSFAVCFALLVHFWFKHYHFFRRYGMQDVTVVVLNAALLFVLLLYIYPLKYIFSMLVYAITGLGPESLGESMKSVTAPQVRTLFIIYGVGFVAVYFLFAAMYWHAYRCREQLKLTRVERFDTLATIIDNFGFAAIGIVSIVLATILPIRSIGWAGWIYGATGPVAALVGKMTARRRSRIPQS